MNNKNQTDDKYLTKVQRQPDISGIGLFVKKIRGKLTKEITPSISYRQTIDIGDSFIAFKFIPYGANVRIDNRTYLLRSVRSIPLTLWRCIGQCSDERDCKHLSEVCIRAEGECL